MVLPEGGQVQPERVCGAATPPATIPRAAKYQSTVADWSSGDATTGWSCLKYGMSAPQYFQYRYERPTATRFDVLAHGDLNGDGVPSTFTLAGVVEAGRVKLAPALAEESPEE